MMLRFPSFLAKHKFILAIFIIAFVLRAAVFFVTHYALNEELRDKVIPLDGRCYVNTLDIVNHWKNNTPYDKPYGMFPTYDFYAAAIISVTGYNPAIVPMVNSFLGALVVFFIYDMTKRIFSKKTAYISATLYAFFPSLVFWSSQNIKDIPCLFIVIISIWVSIRLLTPFRPFHLALLAFVFPLLMGLNELRNYIYIFLLYAVSLSFLVNISKKSYKKNIIYALTFFSFMCLIPQYADAGILARIPRSIYSSLKQKRIIFNFLAIFDIFADFKRIDHIHKGAVKMGKADICPGVDFTLPVNVIKYLPEKMAYFLFAPFPWAARGLTQKMAVPENILWYVIFLFALYGMYIYRTRWRICFAVIFFVAVTLTAYSLVSGNFGTAYRHKAVLLPFFFIWAGAGISQLAERIRER